MGRSKSSNGVHKTGVSSKSLQGTRDKRIAMYIVKNATKGSYNFIEEVYDTLEWAFRAAAQNIDLWPEDTRVVEIFPAKYCGNGEYDKVEGSKAITIDAKFHKS